MTKMEQEALWLSTTRLTNRQPE